MCTQTIEGCGIFLYITIVGGRMWLLRIVMIDDEPSVLEGLRLMVPWEELGLELCGEATDGMEGLALIEAISPDIVVTDIRMPRLDGLKLCERFAGLRSAPKFIIISGYSDFEYARSAIRYGVKNYLLKPLDASELKEAFSDIALEIQDDKLRASETLELARYIVSYYTSRAIKNTASQKLFHKLTFILGLMPEIRYRLVLVMVKDFFRDFQQTEPAAVLQGITDALCLKQAELTYYRGLGVFFAVVREDSGVYHHLSAACEALRGTLSVPTVQFISSPGSGILQLAELHRQVALLRLWYYYGSQNPLQSYEKTPEPVTFDEGFWLELPYEALEQSVAKGLTEETRCLVEQFYQILQKARPSPRLLSLYQRRLAHLAEDLSCFYNINIREPLYEYVTGIEDGNLRICRQEAEKIFLRLCGLSKDPFSASHGDLAENLLNYMRENYRDDLSLQVLAEAFSLSPLVVSKTIRKHTGQKFNDVVNEIKIENAKRLIASSDTKLSDVAAEVGYRDIAYFSNKFRQLTGMLPSEYKCLFT